VNSTYVSLDGVIEHLQQWHFDYIDDAATKLAWDQLAASDALLMGRVSYEGHLEAWPSRTGDFADKINSMKKYVVSATLDEAEWNNTDVIKGDLAEEVASIKRQPGADILMYGFGPVADTLLQHGLLDELCLWIHPVLAGVGEPRDLLFRRRDASKLKLLDNQTLDSGVVILTYQPRRH
jgi:dihydrofolate reductase